MKTLLVISLLASSIVLRAAPIAITTYALPDHWSPSEFSHTIGSPRGGPEVPYDFAAILTEQQIESMGSRLSQSTRASIKLPNRARLTVDIDPEYNKPKNPEDIGIAFTVSGPGAVTFASKINLDSGAGFVLRYSPDGAEKPQFFIIQVKIDKANQAMSRCGLMAISGCRCVARGL